MCGESSTGFVEPRLDGPGLATNCAGDLTLAQVCVVAKDNHDAKVRREVLQSAQDVLGDCDATIGIIHCGDSDKLIVLGAMITMRNLFAQFRIASVHHDPVEPRFEARGTRKGVTKLPCAQERLLDGVLRIESMTEYQKRRADRTRITLFEPRLEFVDVFRVVHSAADPF
jgi:hypothetical protein